MIKQKIPSTRHLRVVHMYHVFIIHCNKSLGVVRVKDVTCIEIECESFPKHIVGSPNPLPNSTTIIEMMLVSDPALRLIRLL